MKKVAVTGGLASGKSSVCQILKSCGAYVVSADEIVHRLLSPETEIGKKVILKFGPEILINQKIDRKKVADKTFSDPERLQYLEKLLHPAVLNEIEERYQNTRNDARYALFVAEIPLLYESESHKAFDYVIAVVAGEEFSRSRFEKSTGYLTDEYERRMRRQLPIHEKAARADFVIKNNGSMEDLKKNVKQVFGSIKGVSP